MKTIWLLLLYTVCGLKHCVQTIACTTGFYGSNCPGLCSKNCADTGICSHVTGECEKGCKAGWRSLTCEEKCPTGTFGLNCTEMCGYCRNKEPCDHINGACLNGCDIGFRGTLCKQTFTENHYGDTFPKLCSLNCAYPGECDLVIGECIGGCQAGWKGSLCDHKAEQYSFLVPESRSHTTVLIFVFVAFFCVSCIITIVLMIGIRRSRTQKKQEIQEKAANKLDEKGGYPFII